DAPFVLRARGHDIGASRASLAIRVEPSFLCVTAMSGSIVLTQASEAPIRTLDANEQFVASADGVAISRLSADAVERAISWREGWLEFNGEALSAATEAVSRHTGARFRFEDPQLGQIPYVARFQAGDVDAFLYSLGAGYPMLATRREDGAIIIARRDAGD
ncbi:MAG TPA: hypothetical protein VM915_01675, partial [Verrucomicrobiae bacterium]|nr:hypothetical protein [Verrucomicrobiae bacterium]